jgi:hypothetical protein
MIAIDWSHTKGLATFDGKKLRIEDKKSLVKRLSKKDKDGEESTALVKSIISFHSPCLILEQGCPASLIYDLLRAGSLVYLISNRATQDYRVAHGIEKTDENDARIIWELANNGAKLKEVNLDDRVMQMHSLYHQYCRYLKARVAMQNMRKAYLRHFGDGESNDVVKSRRRLQPSPKAFDMQGSESIVTLKSIQAVQLPLRSEDGESRQSLKSIGTVQPSSDIAPYDTAIDIFKAKEHNLLARLIPLIARGESRHDVKSTAPLQPLAIKGLGDRIWAGLIITANPAYFKSLSAYLRFCGLTGDVIESHKYNRHARMLYHMLADEVMKQKDPTFRPIYDKCKADITEKHSDYTKLHIHNAALNKTATMLAKAIFQHFKEPGGESIRAIKSRKLFQPPGSDNQEV